MCGGLSDRLVVAVEYIEYFRQVRVDDEARTIVWPNGLDPDPVEAWLGHERACLDMNVAAAGDWPAEVSHSSARRRAVG